MGKVVLDMTVSLDGCVAGADGGDAGLHDWYFSPTSRAQEVIGELVATTGAMVMGKRTYDEGARQGGFAENPYQVDHVVLCHEPPAVPAEGTPFIFVTDGIESAVAKAKAAAGDRNVIVGGGATIARLCLEADLIDEINLAVRPLVLPGGLSLFEGLTRVPQLEAGRVRPMPPAITLMNFRVVRGPRAGRAGSCRPGPARRAVQPSGARPRRGAPVAQRRCEW